MLELNLIQFSEFERIRKAQFDRYKKLQTLADMCRVNALVAVKHAGSGHLGSSFSSMDIVVWLYYVEMNTVNVGLDSPDRDVYLSSKGHDVPGLYSVLFSLGILSEAQILKLRRLGGLDGHPDTGVRGIESNSGSLGMGISKGRGMAWAKRKLNHSGRVFVMTGDGELQEGQIYESLQTTVQQQIDLTVILDHNKVQSDKLVQEITDLGDLPKKFECFGWHVERADGNDFRALEKAFSALRAIKDKPKILVADTIKGKGVSFMEHPAALKEGKGLYPWHAGAPDDASFESAYSELTDRINGYLSQENISPLEMKMVEPIQKTHAHKFVQPESTGEPISEAAISKSKKKALNKYVVEAYGKALTELGRDHPEMVVLDADLSSDCRIRSFENTYPQNFIENGIAEQDMVSMAGGLARMGLLPIVNSFSSFLASRANEQIYNNATENTKIIYAFHYAGLIPAGPGKSHQSIRDISLIGALPNVTIIQPCNAIETEMALKYCVNESLESCVLRMNIGPSPRIIQIPKDYALAYGRGVKLSQGDDAILLGYGPVMLHEALIAAKILFKKGIKLTVMNMPWLNRVDQDWLQEIIEPFTKIYFLEDHAPVGGLADFLVNELVDCNLLTSRSVMKFAVEGYPACGTPVEALRYHKLDGVSLAEQISEIL